MTKEPILIIGTILATLNAIQAAAISMPAWAHTVIIVVTITLGTILGRSQVTPANPPVVNAAPPSSPGI